MNSPITIFFDHSSLELSHHAVTRRGESSATYGREAPRWRAAAKQMLARIGADKAEWHFCNVTTSVRDDGSKYVLFRFERVDEFESLEASLA